MKKISIFTIITILTLTLISGTTASARKINSGNKIKEKPYNIKKDQFINETQIIMSKDEIEIYKHLPDEEARAAFVEDFWKKRDPTPGTEENENRMEYERRFEYVNQFFRERVGKGRGWDSDRGKVYMYLGEPDERTTHQGTIIDQFGQRKQALMETWIYHYYRLRLEFIDRDGLGVYRLRNWSASLLTAFDMAKFAINANKKADQNFKFKSIVENNQVNIRIPIKTISFDEKEETMNARFKITMFIYHNYKKIDQMEKTQNVEGTKDELLKRENIEFAIPITLSAKGKYVFDIIVEEMSTGARYRDTIKYKL